MSYDDAYWMNKAFQLALSAQKQGEVPVGAVLIDRNHHIVGQGYNETITKNNPCAHAEMIALRHAASNIQNCRLLKTTLYVTLEPCAMCAGALVLARVERLVFATRDFKTGAAGSVFNIVHNDALNHKIQVDEGVMQEECAFLLKQFFRQSS